MTDTAIHCDRLAKQYRIGERQRYKTLRETIAAAVTSPLRRLQSGANGRNHDKKFWALRDVSFDVKRGEVVGIIGRNGAGKSTLLKILSRITEPTEGRAEIWGRVGSLLEVGTGFHAELTGRDNIYLNGAILGMRKAEIDRKFDEIVAFSEVEDFIDTPVKRYSSGMYVRLAFAVAAHMDTEILIVDEVLAVGDTQFQKKCLGKMGDVARQGRTVLLVSHNMAAIHSLCGRVILLQDGRAVHDGDPLEVTRHYLSSFDQTMGGGIVDLRSSLLTRQGKGVFFSELQLKNRHGAVTTAYVPGDNLVVELRLEPPVSVSQPVLSIGIDDEVGRRVFTVRTMYSDFCAPVLDGPTTVVCTVPDLCLAPGRYAAHLCVGTPYEPMLDLIHNAIAFDVHAADYFGTGQLPSRDMGDLGPVLIKSQWRVAAG